MTKQQRKKQRGGQQIGEQNKISETPGGNPVVVAEQDMKKKSKFSERHKKKLDMLWAFGGLIFIASFLCITERLVFAGVPWSPIAISGFCLTLLIFFFPRVMIAFEEMNASGKYPGAGQKLWWFITSPYFLTLGLIGSIGIVGAQIGGFMATKGAAEVRDKLHNNMSGLWRGLWGINMVNVMVFLMFMFKMPFDDELTNSAGRVIPLYDNIHAKGIMINLLLLSLFFTAFFVVEFNTKFNVI